MPHRSTFSNLLFSAIIIIAALALGASPPANRGGGRSYVRPGPTTLTLAGSQILFNGCAVMDVYEGPPGLEDAFLRWTDPMSRQVWLQEEFDRALERYRGDLWGAFVDLGGGLRQASSGFVVEARSTGETANCGGAELPVFDVVSVLGAYDLASRRQLTRATQPLVASGLDDRDPEMAEILRAGPPGRAHDRDMVIEVGGVTDESLGCPRWALVDSRSVSYDCESPWGFVDLGAAGWELSLRRGPIRLRGHFTGEVSLWRGTEAVFLTPVFEVAGRAAD